jgi:nucleotide-binding universal stress UspA family protein
MRILICSDGTEAAHSAINIGAMIAGPIKSEITLLGIAEKSPDEAALRQALERQAQSLGERDLKPGIVIRAGDPVRQIFLQTSRTNYDLVVIGSRQKGEFGDYWRSGRTYEVIKSIPPPVLVAIGDCARLKRFLVCTGGKEFIEEAIQLTGKVAAAVGATVTLLHVMAEPPALYADLVRLEEDVERLLQSGSELGINLAQQKKDLERAGVLTEIRVRHGLVVNQVFEEVDTGNYDLIVTGSSRARGIFRHYIMGDLTRRILNRANCPVLVARAGKVVTARSSWNSFKGLFRARQAESKKGLSGELDGNTTGTKVMPTGRRASE